MHVMKGSGIFGIEMFVTENDVLIKCEIALGPTILDTILQ